MALPDVGSAWLHGPAAGHWCWHDAPPFSCGYRPSAAACHQPGSPDPPVCCCLQTLASLERRNYHGVDFKVDNVLVSPGDRGCRPVLIDCFDGWSSDSDSTSEHAVCESARITSLALLEPAPRAARSGRGTSGHGPALDLLGPCLQRACGSQACTHPLLPAERCTTAL